MSIATVSLKGELSWAVRSKNRLTPTMGLSRVARSLAAISQEQKVKVKAERGVLTYFNERTQNWSTVKGSGRLGQRLEGSLGELTLDGPVDAGTLKSTFRALLKQPLHIWGSKLSEQGIAVRGTDGGELKFPVTWKNLKEDILRVNFDFKLEHAIAWGGVGALITGFVGFLNTLAVSQLEHHVSLFDQSFCNDHPVIFMGGAAIAGGVVGCSVYLLETLGRLMVWAPTRLYQLARFNGDYKAVFEASNGRQLSQRQEKTLERVLANARGKTQLKVRATALAQINDPLFSGKMDTIVATITAASPCQGDGEILEKLAMHSKTTARALARILSCEVVIPKSKKVVDKAEETGTREETEYDEYNVSCAWHQVSYVVSPEVSHQEYGDKDIAKALGILKRRDQDYIRQTLEALETSGNLKLTKALRASLLAADA
ncbi:MAG: hypothetical protein WC772_03620 [Candidatus Margulisiibacteriota bacterium]|jgi:hypothetical protein